MSKSRGMFFPYINGRYVNPWDGTEKNKKYRSLCDMEETEEAVDTKRKEKVLDATK